MSHNPYRRLDLEDIFGPTPTPADHRVAVGLARRAAIRSLDRLDPDEDRTAWGAFLGGSRVPPPVWDVSPATKAIDWAISAAEVAAGDDSIDLIASAGGDPTIMGAELYARVSALLPRMSRGTVTRIASDAMTEAVNAAGRRAHSPHGYDAEREARAGETRAQIRDLAELRPDLA